MYQRDEVAQSCPYFSIFPQLCARFTLLMSVRRSADNLKSPLHKNSALPTPTVTPKPRPTALWEYMGGINTDNDRM